MNLIKNMHQTDARVLSALQRAVGERYVTSNEFDRAAYAFGSGGATQGIEERGEPPDYVVLPSTTEDVRMVLKIANEFKVPVTGVGSGLSSYLFPDGGICLDFNPRMHSICEINAADGYAVIEPGVTYGQLSRALLEHNCHYPQGTFPGTVSILSQLTRTSGAWTLWAQQGSNDLISVEVVLGSGEVVRTGFAAMEPPDWHLTSGHAIMPDYACLFKHSQGALGIVTRGSVRIFSRNEKRAMPVVVFDDMVDATGFVLKLSRAYLVEHGSIHHYNHVRFYNAFYNVPPEEVPAYLNKIFAEQDRSSAEKLPGWPYLFVPLMLSGYSGEIEHRLEFIGEFARRHNGRVLSEGEARKYLGHRYDLWLKSFVEHLPDDLFLRNKYIGPPGMIKNNLFVGPSRVMPAVERMVMETYHERGFDFVWHYTNPEEHGRTCYLMIGAIVEPDADESRVTERDAVIGEVFQSADELFACEGVHAGGPSWDRYAPRGVCGGTARWLRQIKQVCDPNGILSPAHPFFTPATRRQQ